VNNQVESVLTTTITMIVAGFVMAVVFYFILAFVMYALDVRKERRR